MPADEPQLPLHVHIPPWTADERARWRARRGGIWQPVPIFGTVDERLDQIIKRLRERGY